MTAADPDPERADPERADPERGRGAPALAVKVTDLTGPGRTDRFRVGGTDLGTTTTAPDGRLVSVFGDTFARGGARARQLVRYLHHGVRRWGTRLRRVTTVLPTDVLTVGEVMYLHVMVCRELGNVRWTELHRSMDNGNRWRSARTRWPAEEHDGLFQMLTWERGGDGWVYAFSTGFQRAHGLLLHRVPEGRVAVPEAWQTWGLRDGSWGWGNPPTVVLPGRFGELCLRRVQDRWMLVVFDDGAYRIDVLALDAPTADLHRAPRATVLEGCAWGAEDHASGRVAQLYGGYVVPGSTWDDLHLVVSQWNSATNWPYRAMQFRVDVSSLVDRR